MTRLSLIIIIALGLGVSACKRKSDTNNKSEKVKPCLREEQKRKYFADSIAFRYGNGFMERDSALKFSYFMRTNYPDIKAQNVYDPFIYAFEENYIEPAKIDSSINWFRITVDPCFRRPYCIIVENKLHKTYVTAKMTNGDGGYHCGLLDFSLTKIFSDSLYNDISKQLHELNFWKLKKDTVCGGGFDGETWTIEAIEKGQYNIIYRWVPQDCGDKTTRQLGQLGLQIRGKSKLLDIFALTYGLDRKKQKDKNYLDEY